MMSNLLLVALGLLCVISNAEDAVSTLVFQFETTAPPATSLTESPTTVEVTTITVADTTNTSTPQPTVATPYSAEGQMTITNADMSNPNAQATFESALKTVTGAQGVDAIYKLEEVTSRLLHDLPKLQPKMKQERIQFLRVVARRLQTGTYSVSYTLFYDNQATALAKLVESEIQTNDFPSKLVEQLQTLDSGNVEPFFNTAVVENTQPPLLPPVVISTGQETTTTTVSTSTEAGSEDRAVDDEEDELLLPAWAIVLISVIGAVVIVFIIICSCCLKGMCVQKKGALDDSDKAYYDDEVFNLDKGEDSDFRSSKRGLSVYHSDTTIGSDSYLHAN